MAPLRWPPNGCAAGTFRPAPPGAVQVADRFHLRQNLAEALEVVFSGHAADLHAAEQARRLERRFLLAA